MEDQRGLVDRVVDQGCALISEYASKPIYAGYRKAAFMKKLLIVVGFLSVGVGFLGIFLPLLPTTPLLLLAAFCFANSSERFHRWLLGNRLFGAYIRDYVEKGGVSLRIKVSAISLIWISIGYCTAFLLENWYLRTGLLAIAAAVSIYLLRLPTIRK
jgi:uncharacterized membrane protein YbaN (DUF454 family)